MSESPRSQKRVVIWGVARSLSSALVRCLSQVPDSVILFEPFVSAAVLGPQRVSHSPYECCATETFESVKALCEQPWEGKSLVLAKDMAFALPGKYEMIPEGYQHVFLIRNPAKSIPSLETVFAPVPKDQKEFYFGFKQYKDSYDLHRHVTSKLGLKATILDSQDLIKNPEKTIQTLCQILGLSFSNQLLTWDPVDGKPSNWMMSPAMWEDCEQLGWIDHCLRSTGFVKPVEQGQKSEGGETVKRPMTAEVEKMIEEALPYYQALWELRIKP